AFEQRRLEPAAVLVTAFEIQIGGPALFGPVAAFQREDMGAAAVEPDVEDVGDPLKVVGVAIAEELGGIAGVPGVDAGLADGIGDALVDLMIDERLSGLAVDEQSDRHAPGALAAQHPVGPLRDHRAQAVAALLRHKARVGDGLESEFSEGLPRALTLSLSKGGAVRFGPGTGGGVGSVL